MRRSPASWASRGASVRGPHRLAFSEQPNDGVCDTDAGKYGHGAGVAKEPQLQQWRGALERDDEDEGQGKRGQGRHTCPAVPWALDEVVEEEQRAGGERGRTKEVEPLPGELRSGDLGASSVAAATISSAIGSGANGGSRPLIQVRPAPMTRPSVKPVVPNTVQAHDASQGRRLPL